MEVKRVAFDTSAYSMLRQGHQKVRDILEAAEEIYLSPIVVGELLFGFKNGSKLEWNKRVLKSFVEAGVSIHKISAEAADIYSDIILNLKKKGIPIPTNDIWIAAQSIEQGSVLLTFDKHFEEIEGLRFIRFE